MKAAVIVGTMSDDQNLIAAAALHDVVEDVGIPIEEIEERFGRLVRELVQSETEDKRSNMRSIYRDFKVEGIGMWPRFNQKDVNQQATDRLSI